MGYCVEGKGTDPRERSLFQMKKTFPQNIKNITWMLMARFWRKPE